MSRLKNQAPDARVRARAAAVPSRRTAWLLPVLLVVLAGLFFLASQPRARVVVSPTPAVATGPLQFTSIQLAAPDRENRIAHVQVIDFDQDGLNDILVCDVARSAVLLYRQKPDHTFVEQTLGDRLNVPAHATVVDLDGDGDLDVVVSILGNIFPSDELVGKVMVLENQGQGRFTPSVVLEDVRRVADVQAADFNGDGKTDLAVAVFGYAHGEVLWLENLGKTAGHWQFRDHHLLDRPGTIHVPVGDYNGDGRPDIAAVVTQDEEEVWCLENAGGGKFVPHRIYYSHNFDVGGAGLVACDLNQDGRLDLLLPQGDNLEDRYSWPQPYHGCVWLENQGNFKFVAHQIGSFGGTYAAAAGDLDKDGFIDVALVSYLSDGRRPSVAWLKNDGKQNFTFHSIATQPVGLVTVAVGDLNHDGNLDIVSGGLHLPPMTTNGYGRLPIWYSQPAK